MTEEKALTTTKPSALDVYGSGTDIRTLAERIKACLPGGSKLAVNDALALAQLSVAYELNPFNGEVWYIPGRGTMVGIKGLRKAARKQGNYWPTFDVLTKAEKAELGIPENAVAYRCKIYRTDLLRQAAESIDLMRKAGMANAFEVYAYKPAEGIGYGLPTEDSRMKLDQRARKRAEADALKVAFDLPFASEVGNGNRIGYIDAEWEAVPSGPEWTESIVLESEPVVEFADLPHEPSAFLGAVNKVTGFYYKNLHHLLNAIGEKSWPGTKDTAAWADYYKRALAHAAEKHGETPAAVEQTELL